MKDHRVDVVLSQNHHSKILRLSNFIWHESIPIAHIGKKLQSLSSLKVQPHHLILFFGFHSKLRAGHMVIKVVCLKINIHKMFHEIAVPIEFVFRIIFLFQCVLRK